MPIEKHHVVITVETIKELNERGVKYEFRYLKVGKTDDGTPLYNVIYWFDDKEHILVNSRLKDGKIAERELRLYPGLINYHFRHHIGHSFTIEPDYEIRCEKP